MIKTLIAAVIFALLPTQVFADKSHAEILWDQGRTGYHTCRSDQTARSVWRVELDFYQTFEDALNEPPSHSGQRGITIWFEDKNGKLWFVDNFFTVAEGPNQTLVQYMIYSTSNTISYRWVGVNYSDSPSNILYWYRHECIDGTNIKTGHKMQPAHGD